MIFSAINELYLHLDQSNNVPQSILIYKFSEIQETSPKLREIKMTLSIGFRQAVKMAATYKSNSKTSWTADFVQSLSWKRPIPDHRLNCATPGEIVKMSKIVVHRIL